MLQNQFDFVLFQMLGYGFATFKGTLGRIWFERIEKPTCKTVFSSLGYAVQSLEKNLIA
jgi:hypothetical protein